MKTDLDYLPAPKQEELCTLTQVIRDHVSVEMIILFGSYARGDWEEEKADDGIHYVYQSDFDVLVIVETRSESAQSKFERELERQLDQHEEINTPISILVHDIGFMNRRLGKAQYFFSDIKKEGVMLYDSGQCHLTEPRELSPKERQRLAKEDFEHWFSNASKKEITLFV